MSPLAALRPDRAMAFPFAAVLAVLLWFLNRDVGMRLGRADLAVDWPQTVLFALLAVVGSYAVAVALVAALHGVDPSAPGWATPLASPSDATLRTFAVVAALLGTYVVSGTFVAFPDWVDTVAAPVGLVLGWPLVPFVFAYSAIGNALGTELPFLVEAGFVAVGIVAAVAWLFLLSSWVGTLAGVVGARASTRAT